MAHHKISYEDYTKYLDSIRKFGEFSTGSAILIQDKGYHFILSARHVLIDPTETDSTTLASQLLIINTDTVIKDDEKPSFMTNLSDGGYNTNPYLLSSISDDVGIICLDLDGRTNTFYEYLIQHGYIFKDINAIEAKFNLREGDRLTALGFPPTAQRVLNGSANPFPLDFFKSSLISTLIFSKGIYYKSLQNSNYFDAFIYVTHGFSGGPVLKNNKLVGIVHGGDFYETYFTKENGSFKYISENHSLFIKSPLIVSMIKQLEQKIEYLKKEKFF